jgi:hypothetical protein
MPIPYMSLLKYIGLPLVGLVCLYLLYSTGYNNGVGAVEAERAADRVAQELVVAELNGQLQEKERLHRVETNKIKDELHVQEATYNNTVKRIYAELDLGLRDSEQRAAHYRALAETGTDQCRSLASHTAGLDASLVEGRSVVEELRSTLELRDSQLILVGSQLLSDRQLYENYGKRSE